MRLCLGGAEFWEHLERDIRAARDYVYVQTLTFEGDAAGQGLAEALLACAAPRKRIVVDAVTKYLINDRFIGLPAARRDAVLQREVAATGEMCDRLERGGVPVRFTWPVGRRFHRLIARNHKKLIAIDDRIAYLGGINFGDHNFAWHDFMIRIESPGIAAFLREDFEHTWRGNDQAAAARIGGDEIVVGEGRGNAGLRGAVSRALDRATDRIVVQCPYVSEPFWSALGRAHRRGLHVTVMMPEAHNRAVMKWGTLDAARREGFEVLMLPGPMTHAKVMQIDDSVVLGSGELRLRELSHAAGGRAHHEGARSRPRDRRAHTRARSRALPGAGEGAPPAVARAPGRHLDACAGVAVLLDTRATAESNPTRDMARRTRKAGPGIAAPPGNSRGDSSGNPSERN